MLRHKLRYVHRVVAKAFIPNPMNKPQVNHKNGIKTDNRVENLEWVTPGENTLHSFEIGLNKSGEDHYKAKLKKGDVLKIRALAKEGTSEAEISEMFQIVSRRNINDILNRKTWKHI